MDFYDIITGIAMDKKQRQSDAPQIPVNAQYGRTIMVASEKIEAAVRLLSEDTPPHASFFSARMRVATHAKTRISTCS